MEDTLRSSHLGECDVLALGGTDILELLAGNELEILEITRAAYLAHGRGESSLPYSSFLHFSEDRRCRIIALPAYLGGQTDSAGLKWISSFPANVESGADRASAVVILNSTTTGRPKAVIEGSIISAKRTAASAALAACVLQREPASSVGMIGCGPINFEIARFLLAASPGVEKLLVYDLDYTRARAFKEQCEATFPSIDVEAVLEMGKILATANLISFATNAGRPHIQDLQASPCSTVLHISLRDLSPQVVLSSDNVVDDINHVCREQTSIHLTEQQVGHRGFIRCTLAAILNGAASPRCDGKSPVIFSPFGLGILDIALGEYIFRRATKENRGFVVPSFFPPSWRGSAWKR